MFTMAVLVCFDTTRCVSWTDGLTYKTKEECVVAVLEQIEYNKHLVETGQAPPHTVKYECLSWEQA